MSVEIQEQINKGTLLSSVAETPLPSFVLFLIAQASDATYTTLSLRLAGAASEFNPILGNLQEQIGIDGMNGFKFLASFLIVGVVEAARRRAYDKPLVPPLKGLRIANLITSGVALANGAQLLAFHR